MSINIKNIYNALLVVVLSSFAAVASANIDDDAQIVNLRLDCTVSGSQLDNCFDDMSTFTNWLAITRQPGVSDPLKVLVGPGTFPPLRLTCDPLGNYTGYISFHGAGRAQTIFETTDFNGYGIIKMNSCTNMSFNDLGGRSLGYDYLIWNGGGESVWTNVEFNTTARGWVETTCGETRGRHTWNNSKIQTKKRFGIGENYIANCDESWFYGSEIVLFEENTYTTGGVGITYAIHASNDGEVHVYGSVIRSLSDYSTGDMVAVRADSGGIVHIHGTGIDVISAPVKNITALMARSGGTIHANQSSYVMKTGAGGVRTRIDNSGGTVGAFYQWQSGNQPLTDFSSQNGSDSIIEINCDPTGCHDVDTGTEMHTLIYNDNCNVASHGPWFNTTTGKCRGQL